MLKKIKIAVLIFACTSALQVRGQNNENQFPTEGIRIHTSQQVLFSGELLWFSLFSSNNIAEQDLSTLAFVELISSNNTSVLRKKVKLSNCNGSSYFEIPASLGTGIYRILAYTNWMKNQDKKLFSTLEISIINPEQAFNPITSKNNGTIKSNPNSATKNNPVFEKRKKVSLPEVLDVAHLKEGVFSVSIKRKEPLLFAPTKNSFIGNAVTKNGESYLPDYKGIIVSGTLYDAENNVAREKEVLLSLPGKGVDIMRSITDENGTFNFLLESQNGSSDLVFTLPGSEMKIKLEDPFLNDLRFSNNPVLELDSMALDFLKEKYFHTQLSQRFGKTDYTPASPDTLIKQAFSFHSAPSRIFRTEDYLLLDSVTEYFRELIPSVHFNRKKDGYTLSVIQQKSKIIIGNKPGVFIDGVYYTNYDNIAKIPTDKIDCIKVLWEKYHYKNFTFDGIVSIHTKKADFYSVDLQENMTRIIYPLSDKNSIQFKAKVYSENNRSSKRPDLRYLLYWNPSVCASQLNQIHFDTSDVAGFYEITFSGYSSKGDWISHTSEFEVKE